MRVTSCSFGEDRKKKKVLCVFFKSQDDVFAALFNGATDQTKGRIENKTGGSRVIPRKLEEG